jgi:hypothetical protein
VKGWKALDYWSLQLMARSIEITRMFQVAEGGGKKETRERERERESEQGREGGRETKSHVTIFYYKCIGYTIF